MKPVLRGNKLDKSSFYVTRNKGRMPPDYIMDAKKNYEQGDEEYYDIVDGKLIFDKSKRDQDIIDRKNVKEAEKKAKRDALKAKRDASKLLKNQIKAFKKADFNDPQKLKDVLDLIMKKVLELDKAINKGEG